MQKNKGKLAILTSGGDAPGMNSVIAAILNATTNKNMEVYYAKEGFKGLYEDKIFPLSYELISQNINKSGSIIKCSRFDKFKEEEYQKTSIKNLKNRDINNLIVIGGNGSYLGALKLSKMGINCISIPATIDNDVCGTQYAIGFDSAVNYVVDTVDNLRNTANSHKRCIIIEVMGRYSDAITYHAALSTQCEIISTHFNQLTYQEIIEKIKTLKIEKLNSIIIIVSEKLKYDLNHLSNLINKETEIETRYLILGLAQRGAKPSAFDRKLATMMGVVAVEQIINKKNGIAIAWQNNTPTYTSIENCLNLKKADYKLNEEIFHCLKKT